MNLHFRLHRTTIYLLLWLLLPACDTGGGEVQVGMATRMYPNVDERMWIYFERFEKAAQERNESIDLVEAGISGEIYEISKANVVGLCNHNVIDPNHIILDGHFWNRSSNLKKELIVFHELGHCYLLRGHKDDVNENGTCASVMRSGTGGCLDLYNEDNRREYLDELFDAE
ncbi:MAG: hypothetical protein AB8G22_00925 [Saprospiraceae bacterium]